MNKYITIPSENTNVYKQLRREFFQGSHVGWIWGMNNSIASWSGFCKWGSELAVVF